MKYHQPTRGSAMKKALFYCFALIAMSFSFIVPAQASGGHDCYSDHDSGVLTLGNIGDPASVIGDKVTDNRSVMHQLEAADFMAYKSNAESEVVGLAKNTNQTDAPAYAYFEVAWRG
jgi:hypothetical protein